MTETILIIDDDANLLAAMQRQLQKEFSIAVARGGDEALAAIYLADTRQTPFAAVVCDMSMPGMDGIEVLQRIKAASPDTMRIMLTGKGDIKTATNAINVGNVFRFFVKPCPAETLAGGLREAVAHYRAIRAERDLLERLGYPKSNETLSPALAGLEPGHPTEMPPGKTAAATAEEETRLKAQAAAEAKKDIQNIVSYDIVNHDRLIALADAIWRAVPTGKRAHYTTEDWQAAIYDKCREALAKAEKKLAESNPEPRMLKANVNILRQAFARQVVRAMQEIAAHYQQYQNRAQGK
ncbi:hydrogenase transcriptional regulatory protein hupR1 [mine drainage metagenome]|uniref:Hydrogenase transcriptional regulatory protein hupR1 n=1 Tax=mine drainage metagenome TaxID=410659 RepID=A0A1J5QXW3_9ZZZZ